MATIDEDGAAVLVEDWHSSRSFRRTVDDLVQVRLDSGGCVRLTVATVSMQPALWPGDNLVVRQVRTDRVRFGDIVVARMGHFMVAHRLIGRRLEDGESLMVTKGDSNAEADDPWSARYLVGVAIAVERRAATIDLQRSRARAVAAAAALISRGAAMASRCRWRAARRVMHRGCSFVLRGMFALM